MAPRVQPKPIPDLPGNSSQTEEQPDATEVLLCVDEETESGKEGGPARGIQTFEGGVAGGEPHPWLEFPTPCLCVSLQVSAEISL